MKKQLTLIISLLTLIVLSVPAQKKDVEEKGVRSKSFSVEKGG